MWWITLPQTRSVALRVDHSQRVVFKSLDRLQSSPFYVKCGEIATARKVFDEMPEKDLVAGSALVSSYARKGLVKEARECGSAVEMLQVFYEMGCKDVGACNALISGFSRNDEVLEVFKRLQSQERELNVVSWKSVIACCSWKGY
ncbi:pentatricopeptide repeat-containing protein [Tanacetum coccineum]